MLPPGHPLRSTHKQALISKHWPLSFGGDKPPKPPKLPAPARPSAAWHRVADTYAAYILVLFRPYTLENVSELEWGWDALGRFMAAIDPPRGAPGAPPPPVRSPLHR